ncbi:MAG: hypothetical protein ACYDCG_12015 [Candidatus Acidiferrales bacterium]
MIGLIPILLLGALILILGGRLLVQRATKGDGQPVSIEEYTRARASLDSMFAETAAIKRVFADEDKEFVSRTGTPDVERVFLKERKRLAIQWVRMTQRQVADLMNLHLKLASYTHVPSPKSEAKLTASYFCFVLASNGLLILLGLLGPFAAVRIVTYALRMSEHFCSAFSIRLQKVDPVKLGLASGSRWV